MQLTTSQKLGIKALYSPTTTSGYWKIRPAINLWLKKSAEGKGVRGCVPLALEHPEDADQISLPWHTALIPLLQTTFLLIYLGLTNSVYLKHTVAVVGRNPKFCCEWRVPGSWAGADMRSSTFPADLTGNDSKLSQGSTICHQAPARSHSHSQPVWGWDREHNCVQKLITGTEISVSLKRWTAMSMDRRINCPSNSQWGLPWDFLRTKEVTLITCLRIFILLYFYLTVK